ncbi:hypothetical protein [Deinococcus maricopensis]|uniref:HPr kinase n=1 Tax=Deinococcus maricopensis (strain DSM 21211 / LMG 22137 / NRRL B-23946 / LB-34) TaxID=709986 RepID=E8U982_DEIML|nr:hypothetical protein [Deinococcus maricopensis]ADV67621.1 hypothetical protein Deima_1976 [Deinococcus maricopensis DSM 21211]
MNHFRSLHTTVTVHGPDRPALRAEWARATTPAPARHTLHVRPPLPRAAHGAARTITTAQGPLPLIADGAHWALAGSTLAFQVDAHTSTLHLPDHPSAQETLAAHLAFTEAHRASGLLPLHAAILTRGAHTVALTGESGAGKSTAALRLLTSGWQLIAEDAAWLDPATRQTYGWDDGLRLHDTSLQRFAPHVNPAALPRDAHGKVILPVTTTAGPPLRTLMVLGAPAHLSAAERVQALWGATGVPLTTAARAAVTAALPGVLRHLQIRGATREDVVHPDFPHH